jgi:hypothetical protein
MNRRKFLRAAFLSAISVLLSLQVSPAQGLAAPKKGKRQAASSLF